MKLKIVTGILLTLFLVSILTTVVPVSVGAYTGPEDVNGDEVVDMKDVSLIAQAFGSYPDHPRWNPTADINEDNKVDMRDLVMVIKAFGAN